MNEPIRLQKLMAQRGLCSRRKAEALIVGGNVKVNGTVIRELGAKVPPTASIELIGEGKKDGQVVQSSQSDEFIYIAMNKPIGVICSASSDQGESVLDLLTQDNQIGSYKVPLTTRVYPVGRLDKDSEGLVLLTNDGELTNRLIHPRYEHKKTYEVTIDAPLTRKAKGVLEHGMVLDDGPVNGIIVQGNKNIGRRTVVTVVLTEGKNRQIRKMFGRLGYRVIALKRTKISKLGLGVLPSGRWRYVRKEQITG